MSEIAQSTILYGMMGSGKSTLGMGLASYLEQPFIDTDKLIEARVGMSIAEIMTDPSRDFSSDQTDTILSYAPTAPEVVATGGSVPVYPELTRHLARLGLPIFLEVDPVALEARLSQERIDALNNPRKLPFAALYAERIPMYRTASSYVLHIGPNEGEEESLERLIALREYAGGARIISDV